MPPSPGGREELGLGGRRPLAPRGRGGAGKWGPRPWEARGLRAGPAEQRVQKQGHQVSTAAERAVGRGGEQRTGAESTGQGRPGHVQCEAVWAVDGGWELPLI